MSFGQNVQRKNIPRILTAFEWECKWTQTERHKKRSQKFINESGKKNNWNFLCLSHLAGRKREERKNMWSKNQKIKNGMWKWRKMTDNQLWTRRKNIKKGRASSIKSMSKSTFLSIHITKTLQMSGNCFFHQNKWVKSIFIERTFSGPDAGREAISYLFPTYRHMGYDSLHWIFYHIFVSCGYWDKCSRTSETASD